MTSHCVVLYLHFTRNIKIVSVIVSKKRKKKKNFKSVRIRWLNMIRIRTKSCNIKHKLIWYAQDVLMA